MQKQQALEVESTGTAGEGAADMGTEPTPSCEPGVEERDGAGVETGAETSQDGQQEENQALEEVSRGAPN